LPQLLDLIPCLAVTKKMDFSYERINSNTPLALKNLRLSASSAGEIMFFMGLPADFAKSAEREFLSSNKYLI